MNPGNTIEARYFVTRKAWFNMHERCYNPKHRGYPSYGGKGIIVCKRWRKFFNADGTRPKIATKEIRKFDRLARSRFMLDIGLKPEVTRNIQLSRKNDIGNYEPGNVEWD